MPSLRIFQRLPSLAQLRSWPVGVSLVLVVAVYGFFAARSIHQKGWNTPTNYYNHFIDSLSKGRLDLEAPNNYDLAQFQGKAYLVWGPAAIIPIAPFYLAGGALASDVVYTCIFAIINCLLFLILCCQLADCLKTGVSTNGLALLGLAFAFVSPNFFLGIGGEIWFVCQTIGLMYALAAGICACALWKNPDQSYYLYLAAVLLCLAWSTRITYIFYLVLLGPLIALNWQHLHSNKWFPSAVATTITAAFLCVNLLHNYLRFGSWTDFGFDYVIPKINVGDGILTWKAVRENLDFYLFRHMTLRLNGNYVYEITNVGASVPSIYPIVFGIFWLMEKRVWQRRSACILLFAFLTVAILELCLLLPKSGFGWTQVGARYLSGILTLLYLSFVLIIDKMPRPLVLFLIGYGFVMQSIAIWIYYD